MNLKHGLGVLALTAMVSTPLTAASRYADTVVGNGPPVLVHEADSVVSKWRVVPYSRPWLSDRCTRFLVEHPQALNGVTVSGCIGSIVSVTNEYGPRTKGVKVAHISDADNIPAGAMIIVPDITNTSTEIAERRERLDVIMEQRQQLAGTPDQLIDTVISLHETMAGFDPVVMTATIEAAADAAARTAVNELFSTFSARMNEVEADVAEHDEAIGELENADQQHEADMVALRAENEALRTQVAENRGSILTIERILRDERNQLLGRVASAP